jgi:signal peptidase
LPGLHYNQTVVSKHPSTRFRLPLILLTIILWVLFAPTKLGGRASYILVSGGSMEPNFHFGDLVITRKANDYQLGEAVAYYDPLLDGVIYHRVVEKAESRYLLQGDANTWIDSYSPTDAEILGKEWIYLPGFGRVLEKARQPLWLAVIAVAFILMAVWPEIQEQKPSDLDPESSSRTYSRGWFMAEKQKNQEVFTLILALAGLGLLGLIFFFTKPAAQFVDKLSTVTHKGSFAYSAPSDTDVYPSGMAETGDPIFRNTSFSMDVVFDYELSGVDPENVTGEYQFNVIVSDDSGWERKMGLIPPTEFSGHQLTLQNTLYYYYIEDIIENYQAATLVERGSFTLTFVPEITVDLASDQRPGEYVFAPELAFQYTPLEVRMFNLPDADPLQPQSDLVLTQQESKDSVFTFLSLSFPVRAARWFFGALMLVSLGAAGYLYWYDTKLSAKGGYASLKYQYGDLLVEVSKKPATVGKTAPGQHHVPGRPGSGFLFCTLTLG